jgi:hypothetical protein
VIPLVRKEERSLARGDEIADDASGLRCRGAEAK